MIPSVTIRSAIAILLLSWLPAKSLDSWGGLHLDKSTPENAIALFGKPSKEKGNQKLNTIIHDLGWLNKDDRYTKLEFKKTEEAKKVTLYFRSGVLKALEIYLSEKGDPNLLESEYGIQFSRKTRSDNFLYGLYYYLIGISEPAFVVAQVGVLELAKIYPGHHTGKVEIMQFISGTMRKDFRRLLVQAAAATFPDDGESLDFFTCQSLDDRKVGIPEEWQKKHRITTWKEAYNLAKVRPLIEKLFSADRSDASP